MTTTQISIEGMTCGHCVGRVKGAIEKIDHVSQVEVTLSPGLAVIESDCSIDLAAVTQAIESVGFSVTN